MTVFMIIFYSKDLTDDRPQVGPGEGYMLTVGGFNTGLSTLGDSMSSNNGMKFTTK